MLRKLKWPFATKRRAVLSSVAVVALVMASVGLAAWLLTVNAGSGRGQAGSISNPVITNVTPAPGDQCMPAAGTTCSVSVSVNNPNTVALKLTAINFNGGSAKIEKPLGTDASGACSSSNITGPINKTGLNIDLPAGATTTVVVPAVWGLAANAPVGCMGVFVYFGLGSSGTDWTIST